MIVFFKEDFLSNYVLLKERKKILCFLKKQDSHRCDYIFADMIALIS